MVVALKYWFWSAMRFPNVLRIYMTYFDDTKAVAAKGQVVRAITGATITKVECLLPVERRSSIGVWDSHLADGQPMKNAAALEANIVQHCAFARIEGQTEAPFLPLH
jgi:hypothetical protein